LRLSPAKFSKTPSQSTTEHRGTPTTEHRGTHLSPQSPQVSQIVRITHSFQPGNKDGHDTLSQWRNVEHGGMCLQSQIW
jgi:hypothetical protein